MIHGSDAERHLLQRFREVVQDLRTYPGEGFPPIVQTLRTLKSIEDPKDFPGNLELEDKGDDGDYVAGRAKAAMERQMQAAHMSPHSS